MRSFLGDSLSIRIQMMSSIARLTRRFCSMVPSAPLAIGGEASAYVPTASVSTFEITQLGMIFTEHQQSEKASNELRLFHSSFLHMTVRLRKRRNRLI